MIYFTYLTSPLGDFIRFQGLPRISFVDFIALIHSCSGSGGPGNAFGQTLLGTASPLTAIPARDGIPDWVQLDALVEKWQPDVFVVGLPFNMDDSDSELLRFSADFSEQPESILESACQMRLEGDDREFGKNRTLSFASSCNQFIVYHVD